MEYFYHLFIWLNFSKHGLKINYKSIFYIIFELLYFKNGFYSNHDYFLQINLNFFCFTSNIFIQIQSLIFYLKLLNLGFDLLPSYICSEIFIFIIDFYLWFDFQHEEDEASLMRNSLLMRFCLLRALLKFKLLGAI